MRLTPSSNDYRPRHPAWENSCDSLTVVGLHEIWTLAIRCQVSGVSSENARAGLKPETRNLKPMLGEGFTTPDNVQKKSYFHSILRGLD
jgi:hypothetical protein